METWKPLQRVPDPKTSCGRSQWVDSRRNSLHKPVQVVQSLSNSRRTSMPGKNKFLEATLSSSCSRRGFEDRQECESADEVRRSISNSFSVWLNGVQVRQPLPQSILLICVVSRCACPASTGKTEVRGPSTGSLFETGSSGALSSSCPATKVWNLVSN